MPNLTAHLAGKVRQIYLTGVHKHEPIDYVCVCIVAYGMQIELSDRVQPDVWDRPALSKGNSGCVRTKVVPLT